MKNLFKKITTSFILISTILFLGSCSTDDDVEVIGSNEPVVLDCDLFTSGEEVILVDDPEALVDYIIPCNVEVKGNLIIEAGVVIEFEENAGFRFKDGNPKVEMNGTAAKPIILTGTQKSKGFWSGLGIGSNNPASTMKYVTVEYAGTAMSGFWNRKGGVKGYAGGIMNFDNCTMQHNEDSGINWENGAGRLTIANSTFTNNDVPIITSPNHINSIDGTSSYSGNVKDYVQLSGEGVSDDITFHKLDVPFFSNGIQPNNEKKRKIIFKPGVTILMDAGSEMRFDNAFHYSHETVMVGTPQERITIKGKEDVPGYWKGIFIWSNNPLNEIGYLDISNAGQTTGHPNGAVKLAYKGYLKIHNTNFINCYEYAVSLEYYHGYTLVIDYNNLNLVNTPKMFSDFEGAEVTNP